MRTREILGAARNPDQLKNLTLADLVKMAGCNMIVEWNGHSFKGRVEPGKNCNVVRNGQTSYLDNQFEIDPDWLVGYDRGSDPATDELIWGSIAGPFEFVRWANFEDEASTPTKAV